MHAQTQQIEEGIAEFQRHKEENEVRGDPYLEDLPENRFPEENVNHGEDDIFTEYGPHLPQETQNQIESYVREMDREYRTNNGTTGSDGSEA